LREGLQQGTTHRDPRATLEQAKQKPDSAKDKQECFNLIAVAVARPISKLFAVNFQLLIVNCQLLIIFVI
jgi:hypothetical protein